MNCNKKFIFHFFSFIFWASNKTNKFSIKIKKEEEEEVVEGNFPDLLQIWNIV